MSSAQTRVEKCNRLLNELESAIRNHEKAASKWIRTSSLDEIARRNAWALVEHHSTRITLVREEIKEMVL